MPEFNQSSAQEDFHPSSHSEESLPTMNGDLSEDQSDQGAPPRPPPPVPPRSPGSPMRVAVTEVGGFPAVDREADRKLERLQQEIAALKKEAKAKEKNMRKLQHKLDKYEATSKAKKVFTSVFVYGATVCV